MRFLPHFVFGPAAVGLSVYALGVVRMPWTNALLLVGAALAAWTLIEYLLHRYVLHFGGRPVREHGRHHAQPRDTVYVAAPLYLSIPVFALLLGIAVAYMVLGSQFNSFVHPFTVLLALPFSASGAFLAMRLADVSLNIYSMIGLLLLMGIVKKNSILLVDFANQRRREGLGVREALLDACPVRLRPILMTSVSTIAAAVPAALAIGPGAEVRVAMAVAVIGGVLVSTLLTLLVVPCAYSLLSRVERAAPKE